MKRIIKFLDVAVEEKDNDGIYGREWDVIHPEDDTYDVADYYRDMSGVIIEKVDGEWHDYEYINDNGDKRIVFVKEDEED